MADKGEYKPDKRTYSERKQKRKTVCVMVSLPPGVHLCGKKLAEVWNTTFSSVISELISKAWEEYRGKNG